MICKSAKQRGILPLFLLALVFSLFASVGRAQTTATLSGTVQDTAGAVIADAQVTLTNEATNVSRTVQSNGTGLYVFPSLEPGSYTLKAAAKNFSPKKVTGIELHAGDTRMVPALALAIGSESQTVTVTADEEMIPIENGQRSDVLESQEIENLALIGRDTTELLKVLPGATTVAGGLTNSGPEYSDLNTGVQQSAVGNGVNVNGAVNRGGTALLSDGANVIDPGNMASSVSVINPEMTQEVTVQASNFTADVPFGPVVISTISKSGSDHYHGEGYFDARNSVLDANDWQDNHRNNPQGPQHYYYPGGNFGGPVPGTHKKLFFWGGYERWLQNQGNSNVLSSYIPSPEMMAGDFSTDNADNQLLCSQGFFVTPGKGYPYGPWCNDLSGTVFPDGSAAAASATLPGWNSTTKSDNGQKIPSAFIDPGAAALAKIWPKANANPSTTPGGYNYVQAIPNINDGWVYRFRIDYALGDNTKIYGSYQQAYDKQLAQGNGAHLYWTPGNAIPYPGGGEPEVFRGKAMAGHFVHNFSSSTTMDFMAAWSFGSFPFTEPDPSAVYKTTLGYPYGKVFSTPSLNIPAYGSAGNETFPDFSQSSIFDNPPGQYAVRKEAPQFSDTVTKVWGAHTVKFGGFTQTTDNYQSTFNSYMDGNLTLGAGANADVLTQQLIGSPVNAVANFVMGVATNYSENDSAPIADTAYMATSGFADDTWKFSKHLTFDIGARIEHIGHWYDRDHIGMAVFYPLRVQADYNDGKYAPGFYWHAIDAGVPLSGQPNRFAYVNPRLGLSYDVFGNGNTVVRGGWGSYRFVTQVNDIDTPLQTAQHVQSYNLPGGHNVLLSQIHNLAVSTCNADCGSGNQGGFDPSDYGQPLTEAYNLTIDQKVKWNSQFEIAYVGSTTTQLSDNSEGIEGSSFSALADQNKTPVGSLYKPDPKTGVLSTNQENVTKNPNLTEEFGIPTGNINSDYHPYGYAYGSSNVYMNQSKAYTNYNGLQVSWIKTAGKIIFDFNGTWSKALGTSLQTNPFNIDANYGPTSIDRPIVFNSSYTYQSGKLHTGNNIVNQVGGGWTISGISTWQAGGYIPAELGNGVPNFNMSLTYVDLPQEPSTGTLGESKWLAAQGLSSGIGAGTYYGTDASLPILPVLTCNPTHNLAHYQLLNGACFAAPAVGAQGGQKFPYMRAAAYFDNDLAIYRTFHLRDQQQVQFRASASDWLNHALPEYSGNNPLTVAYNVDYFSKAITPNFNQTSTGKTPFGVMDTKTQAPYQRIIELNVKYLF